MSDYIDYLKGDCHDRLSVVTIRRTKGESIAIGENITITIFECGKSTVLKIQAPRSIRISRLTEPHS